MFISVWNLHRSPALWERPSDFVPDRFPVDGPTPTEVTHNFAYLPFGGGRRKCIGAHAMPILTLSLYLTLTPTLNLTRTLILTLVLTLTTPVL